MYYIIILHFFPLLNHLLIHCASKYAKKPKPNKVDIDSPSAPLEINDIKKYITITITTQPSSVGL